MRFALFYHSVRSDWNHGNAHFLRGLVRALQARGHDVVVHEPADGWSCEQLVAYHGPRPLAQFAAWFPDIRWAAYRPEHLDLDALLDGVDVVVAHEWTDPAVLAALGRYRRRHTGLRLLFHDTHHRMVSEPESMAALPLEGYDAVLAFGTVLAAAYQRCGWGRAVHVWHEAADVTTFYPRAAAPPRQDVAWVGNWGDGERAAELRDYLVEPVRRLQARLAVYGVRYPAAALELLRGAGADYRGWAPGPRVPRIFAQSRLTVHVPRRWYRERLAGIPTIRVFEALACGVPLICAPWEDAEGLFRPGQDYLLAADPAAMTRHMRRLLDDPDERAALARSGLARIRASHTCAHRAEALERILDLGGATRGSEPVCRADA